MQLETFIVIFVIILLAFIFFIAILARILNGKVPPKIHRLIEGVIIGGIGLGIFGIFQPWTIYLYYYGFQILLLSTLSFIVWSHITPGPEKREVVVRQ